MKSPATGKLYLPKPAARVDKDVERAVKDFQRDHRLAVDGVAGPKTMKAVARALERAGGPSRSRGRAQRPAPAGGAGALGGLVREVHRQDDEADRAWRRLVAYGHRRRRALHAEKAAIEARKGDADAEEMQALLAALGRIEGRLGQLVDVTLHKPEIPAASRPRRRGGCVQSAPPRRGARRRARRRSARARSTPSSSCCAARRSRPAGGCCATS